MVDIDRNGDVQTADYTIANNEGTHSALAKGLISDPSVDNQIGYDSYVFNAETLQYCVRHRTYDPIHGRWIERDPMGYAGGVNLYEYALSSPLFFLDSTGQYPGTPGHGSIISPSASSSLVTNIQNRADTWFDRTISALPVAIKRSNSMGRNLGRFLRLVRKIGTSNNNKFVYTCKWGWIDHGHLMNNALGTYFTGSRDSMENLSFINEMVQDATNSSSRWTPEDLISNELGRDLGAEAIRQDSPMLLNERIGITNFFKPIPSSAFFDISGRWNKLLKEWGAVKWNTGAKVNQQTVQQWLQKDLQSFRKNPVNNAFSIAAALRYYRNTPTWKCLCAGEVPKMPEHRY